MHGFNSDVDPNNCDFNAESGVGTYITIMFLLAGLTAMTYAIARVAESNNPLNYESRLARIISGFFILMMRMLHTKDGDLEITNAENKLIALGPHRTGLEAAVIASKMKGTPPQFFATTAYNFIPGVSSFLKMFKAIPVDANATRGNDGRSSNAGALDYASQALNDKGCVAIFPQGNFAKLGQEPPRVYPGVAKLALKHKIPVHVIRLDGFWCLQNPLIPIVIRNSPYYRAFLSLLHVNNVRARLCCEIDFHLQPKNESLSDEEKVNEICAQLYAYYRHTKELTDEQVASIKTEISDKRHLLIWDNKVKRDGLTKELQKLKEEELKLEEPTFMAMRAD